MIKSFVKIFIFAYLFGCAKSYCGTQDLYVWHVGSSSPNSDQIPTLGAQSLSHWTTRKVQANISWMIEQKLVGVRVTHKLREIFPSSPQRSELRFPTFYIYTSSSLKASRSPEMSPTHPHKVPTPPLTMVGVLELELKALAVKPGSFHPFQKFPWLQGLWPRKQNSIG